MGQPQGPNPPDVTRRGFFRKLLKGSKYVAPAVLVVPMAHLLQGQSSSPHPKMHGM